MRKRWLEFAIVVALVAVVVGWGPVCHNHSGQPSEKNHEPTSEEPATPGGSTAQVAPDLEPSAQGIEIIWTVEPTFFWYREFQVALKTDGEGARWQAHLIPNGELEKEVRSEGTLAPKEWRDFLKGFEEVDGWSWADLGKEGRSVPTDCPYYTLTTRCNGQEKKARVYFLPTEQHERIANYIEKTLADRILTDLEKKCRTNSQAVK